MTNKLAIFVSAFSLCLIVTSLSSSEPEDASKVELKRVYSSKPLEKDKSVRWQHAPFLHGDCSICHLSDNPEDPGKLRAPVKELCLNCHAPTRTMLNNREFVHKPASEDCGYCHNPHNSRYRLLLHRATKELCTSCHVEIGKLLEESKVNHAPAIKGNTCRNCHTSHASSIQHLLVGLPSDICLKCHGKDGLKDDEGKQLTNLVRLMKENRYHHEPINKKDCSACHVAHGSEYFRLLVKYHPKSFYAPYSKETFALCLTCHNMEQSLTQAKTTTLTGFRDGERNLHAVHVSRPKRGRTCRACHGEHAAEQMHIIRDSVPFGSKGWNLEINYVPTRTGGRCGKTCHGPKEYKNK